jgi:hypothetical protein
MEFPGRVSEEPNEPAVAAVTSRNGRYGAKALFTCCLLVALAGSAVLFSRSTPNSQPISSPKANSSKTLEKTLTDVQIARMSSDELAHYVFENHGCNSCHTLGANGKLLFTERGLKLATDFEGCIPLLTAMAAISKVKDNDRTANQNHQAARFEAFGCTTCHEITRGKMTLVNYAPKLKSLHLTCTTSACADCSTSDSVR